MKYGIRQKLIAVMLTFIMVMTACAGLFSVNVFAYSNTISPTLKKIGYGIKDSTGTSDVYEQAFLLNNSVFNVHGGIAICYDSGKPAASTGATYQYIGLAQNTSGSYSAKQAYNCILVAETIATKAKYNALSIPMKAAAIHHAVTKYKEYGAGVSGGSFGGSTEIVCSVAQADLMVDLQTEIVKAAKAANKALPNTSGTTGSITANKTGGGYISGNDYILGTYTLSRSGVSASVKSGSTAGVTASISGTTLTVKILLSKITGAVNYTIGLSKTENASVETLLAYQIAGNTANQRLIVLGTVPVTNTFSGSIAGTTTQANGMVEVYKKDTNGKNLAGAVFSVTNKVTNKKYILGPTNAQGYAKTTNDLPVGQYKVIETVFPENYEGYEKTEWDIEITEQKTAITINAINKLSVGWIEIKKTDNETGKALLNAVYGVYSDEACTNLKDTITTDKNGYGKSNDLIVGKYYLKEKNAPDGYILPITVKEATVTSGGTSSYNFTNAPQKGKIEIAKTDEETNLPLQGAIFTVQAKTDIIVNGEVKYTQGQIVDTITTNANGVTTSKSLYLGNYIVTETTAPDGYVLNTKQHEVSLQYHGQTVEVFTEELNVTDTPQKAKIEVTKFGEVLTGFDFVQTEIGKLHTPIYEIQQLAGAAFDIYALEDITVNGEVKHYKDDLIDAVETVKNVPISSSDLYLGKYLVREKDAPNGYFIGSNEFEIELTYHGQNVSVFVEPVIAENDRQKVKIRLEKTIEENPQYPNPEAYQNVLFGIFTREAIKDGDTVLLEKDKMVDTFGIDNSGQGIARTDLPFGKYYIKELQTAEGWVLNNTEYDFHFKYSNQNIPLQWIDINDQYGEIVNETIKGKVEFVKTSTLDERRLEGAVYGIYRKSDDKLIESCTTDKNGYAISGLLPYGEYYLKEIIPPLHFHVDENIYPFFIGKDTEETVTIHIDVTNEPIIGSLLPSYVEPEGSEGAEYTPNTGDSNNFIIGFVLLLFISGIGLLLSRKKWRTGAKKNMAVFFSALLIFGVAVPAFAADQQSSIEKTAQFTSTSTDFKYDFDTNITEQDSKYTLQSTDYKILESKAIEKTETIEKNVPYNNLYSKNVTAPETVIIEKNGQQITAHLTEISYEPTTITNRTTNVTGYTDYEYKTIKPIPADTKQITYYDTYAKQNVTLNVPFKELQEVEPWVWRSDVNIPITFSTYEADYYKLGDKLIPFNAEKPALKGYENDILALLKLDTAKYKIDNVEWKGAQYIENGTSHRKALAVGQRYTAKYKAVYADTIALPDCAGYNATAHYTADITTATGETEYTVLATAKYFRESSNMILPIVGGVGSAAVVAFLFLWFTTKNVVVYQNGKKVKKTRVLNGCISLGKLQLGGVTQIEIKKGYAGRHIGKIVDVVSNGKHIKTITINEQLRRIEL